MTAHTFIRKEIRGIRVHVLPSDRFKTHAISLYVGTPLSEETVTATALVPFVLRRGSAAYPETRTFREKLEELYGTGFGFDVYKRGNNHIVQFRLDAVADRYAAGGDGHAMLRESLDFLLGTVCRPALEDGRFRGKYVEAEKETVRKMLEAIINDKIRYAAERCQQEMFAGDPFRLNALGRIDDLGGLDAAGLYGAYRRWLAGAQIDLYVVGDTDPETVFALVEECFDAERGETVPYRIGPPPAPRQQVKEAEDALDVSQGKLNLGLTLPVLVPDDDYPAALVYNGILGGFPHAKLFVNVREKASLAYYAASRYDGYKGMIMIQTGIEIANRDKTLAIIKTQLNALRQGDISDSELNQTKSMITSQLKEMNDSAFEIIAFDFNGVLTGKTRSADDFSARVEQVGKADVVRMAEQAELDTVYFLRDRQGGDGQ